MGGKSSAPAAPDYTPIMQAAQTQANLNYKLGQDQLQWAKDQYAQDKGVTDQVVDSYLKSMDENQANAEADRARYESTFVPLQDQYISEAQDYNTAARRDLNMGAAQANVANQFDQARQSAQQDLESYGINPSATRYAALDVGMRTQQAAATAAAGTNASLQTEATGRDLLGNAINIGAGLPAQATSEYGTATSTGNSATGNTLAQTQSGASTMGTSTQYNDLGNQGLNIWGSTMNNEYQDQLSQFEANQQASSGIGDVLGLAAGALTGDVLNKNTLSFAGLKFANGGAIPMAASPSGGAIPDDVPAQVSPGEFVLPADTVRWMGEKAIYGLMDKAKNERAAAQQSAIPMG